MEIDKKNISIREAARLMGKSEMFVRIGIQRGLLPFGTAIQLPNKTKYSYHISPKLFYEYIGVRECVQDENENI